MIRTILTNLFADKKASFAFARETIEELASLKQMIEEGAICSIVDQVLPMHQAAQAHRLVEAEQRRGAIVISIGEPEPEHSND